jgi:hypothetical protein
MKVTRSQWILVTTACLIVAVASAQSGLGRPPGVDESTWIPFSETAGIVLTDAVTQPGSVKLFFPRGPTTGILMVKVGGAWTRVDLELPQARVHALN